MVDPSDIYITVQDKNDNEPIFEQETYIAQIREHSPIGKSSLKLARIQQTDSNFGSLFMAHMFIVGYKSGQKDWESTTDGSLQ